MRTLSALRDPLSGTAMRLALRRFSDECGGVVLRLVIYMGGLALLVIVAVNLFDGLVPVTASEPAAKASWTPAPRSHPAFDVSLLDQVGKTAAYEIVRHPDGGRKDVVRWTAAGDTRPMAELELYRPGPEIDHAGPPAADIAARMDPSGFNEIVGEGIVDSKFGPVALLGFADRMADPKRCLGFMKTLEAGNLRISGWSCQGETMPARRGAIACMLNRIVLLTSGNDPKIAEMFARADLKRVGCTAGSGIPTTSADWVTGAQNPRLRGSF